MRVLFLLVGRGVITGLLVKGSMRALWIDFRIQGPLCFVQ